MVGIWNSLVKETKFGAPGTNPYRDLNQGKRKNKKGTYQCLAASLARHGGQDVLEVRARGDVVVLDEEEPAAAGRGG